MTLPPPNLMSSINDPRGPRTSPPPGNERPAERFSDAMSRADNAHRDRLKDAADAADSTVTQPKSDDRDPIDSDITDSDVVDDQNVDAVDTADDTDATDPVQPTDDSTETDTDTPSGDAHESSAEAHQSPANINGTAPEHARGGAAMHVDARNTQQVLSDTLTRGGASVNGHQQGDLTVQPVAVDPNASEAGRRSATIAAVNPISNGTAESSVAHHVRPAIDRNANQSAPPQSTVAAVNDDAAPDNASLTNATSPRGESAARLAVEGSAEPRPVVSPAFARAAEVDAAVRVEQNTGAAPTTIIDAGGSTIKATAANVAPMEAATTERAAGDLPKLDQPQFTGRVLRGLSAMVNQRGGTMTMRLDPPELGALKIQMTITRGMVTAEFQASTPAAQKMLDQSMATLRTALEGQGLNVERLHVHQGATHQQHGNDTQQDQSHTDAGDGQSRGRGDAQSNHQYRGDGNALFDSIFEELNSGRPSTASHRTVGATP